MHAHTYTKTNTHTHTQENVKQINTKVCTGWRRLIGSPKLQIIFHKRATKYRSLLRKMTYKDKDRMSLRHPVGHMRLYTCKYTHTYTYTCTYIHKDKHTHAHTHAHIHAHAQTNAGRLNSACIVVLFKRNNSNI